MSQLVARCGQKQTFQENSVEAVQHAIGCDATAVEFDVQMTADYLPVISHNFSLLRI